MIKSIVFDYTEKYKPGVGTVCCSPVHEFNEWNQKDVERIISINPFAGENGRCKQIIVFYEQKEKTDN